MRACYLTNPFEDPLSEFRYALDNFSGVELSMDFPKSLPDALLKIKEQISGLLDSTSLARVAHMPCYANLAEVYPPVRRAHMAFLEESMDCARMLGFVKLVVHAGFLSGLGRKARDSARSLALDGLAKVESFAREHSLEVCIENNPPSAGLFSSPAELKELLDTFGFKFTLDAGHMNLSGAPLSKMLDAAGSRLAHIHLHDNFGDHDKHLPLGVGTFDYPSFISELKRSGYDETITLEVFSRDRDYLLLSKKKLESLF